MAEEINTLLTEIRDLQREHLAEYRRVTEKMMAVQLLAVKRQARSLRVGVAALVFVFVGAAMMLYFTWHTGR